MWRRLGSEDFESTNELLAQRSPTCACWFICQEYELHELPEANGNDCPSYFLLPKYAYDYERSDNVWRDYKPLKDTPDLFLRFARLHESDDQVEGILAWVHKYGLLGLDEGWRGGPHETLEAFQREIRRAAAVLAMYEAALSRDNEAARVAYERFPSYAPWHPRGDDRYLLSVLWAATREVARVVWDSCRQDLHVEEPYDPSCVRSEWLFRDLLGAMYLQMYWLITAGGNVTRCTYCGRIISLASPAPDARKTRQDKKFCDDACRQRHHYHTKTKPRRQGESR